MFLSRVTGVLALTLLAACGGNDLAEAPVPLGDFALGLNIVVADNVKMVPISRPATVEEWETVMQKAVADRFGRYQGTKLYNVGISVDAYALAPPGIPIVAAPKSILVITANIWDDASQKKLNPEGKQMTVFESASGDTVIGSGLTRTKQEQMDALSYNAAKQVERWLAEHPEWFGGVATGPRPPPAPTSVSPVAKPAALPAAVLPAPAPAPAVLPAPVTTTPLSAITPPPVVAAPATAAPATAAPAN